VVNLVIVVKTFKFLSKLTDIY